MNTIIPYSRTFTFGRFNIGHVGHVELISKMLTHGEQALVYVSTGGCNNDYDLRVLLLRHLCRFYKLDTSRVYFLKASRPQSAAAQAIQSSPIKEAALVLGFDQRDMGNQLAGYYDVPFIMNPRIRSSSQARYFMGREDLEEHLLEMYSGNKYAVRLAKLLRQEELNRERLLKASK